MNERLQEVFNTYNINILFTVFALPCRVSLGFNPGMIQQPVQNMFSEQQKPQPTQETEMVYSAVKEAV